MKGNILHCSFSLIAGANKSYVFTALFVALSILSPAQTIIPPTIQWQKSLGGSDFDRASVIKQTADNGYIVAGGTASADGNVSDYHGGTADCWIVKLDAYGTIQWQKCLGGSGDEYASSIEETSDGGYIMAATTQSDDGDVSGNHGGSSKEDCWIVKLGDSGKIQWQECLGGTGEDEASTVTQTDDGGYIVAGTSTSNDGDVSGNHGSGSYDCLVIKLDDKGAVQWSQSLGGSGQDLNSGVLPAYDGSGYIVAGTSTSTDGDVTGNYGDYDFWIVKLDTHGLIQWQKNYGGTGSDVANAIERTDNGGYIITGYTSSTDGDVGGGYGGSDCWVLKIDGSGNYQWSRFFGGSGNDIATSIKPTYNGGDAYIIGGYTTSVDQEVTENHGGNDFWIVKLNGTGDILKWQKSFGGSGDELAYSILETSDDGYIVAGSATSTNGDVSGNHGNLDYWIVKLNAEVVVPPDKYVTYLNGSWNDPSIWIGNAVPPPGASVIINSNVFANINAVCSDLTVEPSAYLKVNPGITITVSH